MRILYGVSGEGFGHSSRAKRIIRHLERNGHEVLVMTYGQAYLVLKREFNVLKIEGIELFFKKGKGLSLKRTFWFNGRRLLKNLRNWGTINKRIEEFNPEICVSDMEPTVPIIRRLYKLPLISLDNQHRLTHFKIDVPKKDRKAYRIAKLFVNRCVSKADIFIILSFTKAKVKEKNVHVVDPVLREDVLKLKGKRGKKILVYLTKKDDAFLKMLGKLDGEFVVYGYDVFKKRKNLEFRKAGQRFLEDLRECRAVIASAGFTLIGEALYLKKPYFAIPLKGQFEQMCNSLFLKKAGYGEFSEDPTLEDLEGFLGRLGKYEKKLEKYKVDPFGAEKVMDKVLAVFT